MLQLLQPHSLTHHKSVESHSHRVSSVALNFLQILWTVLKAVNIQKENQHHLCLLPVSETLLHAIPAGLGLPHGALHQVHDMHSDVSALCRANNALPIFLSGHMLFAQALSQIWLKPEQMRF